MSAAATIERAAAGELPAWARVGERRREHIARVAGLLDQWAAALGLDASERVRWRAAGWLHDALRDADPQSLRAELAEPGELSPKLLHGPAVAHRLRREGVDDEELLDAIAFHTIGSPTLRRLGRSLYVADFIEPGRTHSPTLLAALRDRMPTDLGSVTRDVAAARIRHLIGAGSPMLPRTLAFWNALVAEAGT